MTDKGLFKLTTDNNDNSTEVFELELQDFDGNVDDLVKVVVELIKKVIPF